MEPEPTPRATRQASRKETTAPSTPKPPKPRFRFDLPRYNRNFLYPPPFCDKPQGWQMSSPQLLTDSGRPLSPEEKIAEEVAHRRAMRKALKHPRVPARDWRQAHLDNCARDITDVPWVVVTTPEDELFGLLDPNKYVFKCKTDKKTCEKAAKSKTRTRTRPREDAGTQREEGQEETQDVLEMMADIRGHQ